MLRGVAANMLRGVAANRLRCVAASMLRRLDLHTAQQHVGLSLVDPLDLHRAIRPRAVVPCGNRVRRAVSHICAGTGLTPPTSAPGLGSPLPHLRQDWAHPSHICAGTGLTAPTSAPGLGSPLPHLRQDWAHPSHIRTRTAQHRLCAHVRCTCERPSTRWSASMYTRAGSSTSVTRRGRVLRVVCHVSWPSVDRRAPVPHGYSGLRVSTQGRAPVPHEARATARSSSMLEPIAARNPNVEKEYE